MCLHPWKYLLRLPNEYPMPYAKTTTGWSTTCIWNWRNTAILSSGDEMVAGMRGKVRIDQIYALLAK